jgi:uncharacterized membrane protein
MVLLGPVQLVVVGLPNENLKGQIARQLHAASDSGAIRVLDALAIQKRSDGTIISLGASDLSPDQRYEYGAIVGGLMGFGATGTDEGTEEGAVLGAMAFADHTFGMTDDDIQAVAADLPAGTTALVVLFEHRWALGLKQALRDTGGVVLAQGLVQPEDLMAFGAELATAASIANQPDSSQDMVAH